MLNLTVNIFNDASTSYFHNSIGGYHGAKMQRYQDLIDFHIQNEIQNIAQTLQGKNAQATIDKTLKTQEVLNMLNTRHIIYRKDAAPLQNKFALGNAWFVNEYKFVEDAMAEIKALNNFNPAKTAVIDKDFKDKVNITNVQKDTSGVIRLSQYEPNHLAYQFKADNDQLVVFSEVYYPKGWKLLVDGEERDLFRANYILRAAVIPAGEHTVEMKFEPKSYYVGNTIAGYSSIMLLVLVFGVLGYEVYRWYNNQVLYSTNNKK